jgi:hypothetical protein
MRELRAQLRAAVEGDVSRKRSCIPQDELSPWSRSDCRQLAIRHDECSFGPP